MNQSPLQQKAEELLRSVRGKRLTTDERRAAAIDLAGMMLTEASQVQTPHEKEQQAQLARMMEDPNGKAFTTSMTDQCFRSRISKRVADQLIFLLDKYGVPHFLTLGKKIQLAGFQTLGKVIPGVLVPFAKHMLRKETATVILPGETEALQKHIKKREAEGVRVNLNHLGEAILGEGEAHHRLQIYLEDLAKPEVEYISVKISTIASQINLLDWKGTLDTLAERLKQLYRSAMNHKYRKPDGTEVSKFVNLDMEEYRDLRITVDLFKMVLDEPEFQRHSAGIVLQAYLPDSFLIQQELTVWAMQRVASGGAPIKIRIVKGANLAMEKVEADIRGWPQTPYTTKAEVDANYKRMVEYGCLPEHAKAANIGVGSHNLFDIAYAMLLRAESRVEKEVCFEMLEGMADHMRRVVQKLSGDMLLYCPAATKEEFQNAVAYFVRRLDENTAPDNFLRHVFGMTPGSKEWVSQAELFSAACREADTVSFTPRRTQNRLDDPQRQDPCSLFQNEPDTDWALPQNRKWAEEVVAEWSQKEISPIPFVVAGEPTYPGGRKGIGEDPSRPGMKLYEYALAERQDVEKAIKTAVDAQRQWSKTSPEERSALLMEAAQQLRLHRSALIGVMIADTGKTIPEADVEISEAIDFADYYGRAVEEAYHLEDIRWTPKGTVLVTPPWNFPCSIPAGSIMAALAAGNCVIFKPAAESVLVGWELVQLLWKAGFSRQVLQFITCEDEPVGSLLIKDPRIDAVILTGATSTAKKFLRIRPGLDLIAETGGKNGMVISDVSDRDLAIKDLVQSAFGHAGQKCSACSLAICEPGVYDDPTFRKQLRDAAASLHVGPAWDPATKVNPLIRPPSVELLRGLTQLEEGEEWLLEPKQDPSNPHLWSPGIKLGVKPGSFLQQTELFGPVLGLIRAKNLDDAVAIANSTSYGLTAGLHSLDEREHSHWLVAIEAGNCYINRGITGAIVQRQPFGGCKESCFGRGAKAGGPNYVMQLMRPAQVELPEHADPVSDTVQELTHYLEKQDLGQEQLAIWNSSVGSYAFYWNHYFSQDHDPSGIVGQDNILRYLPQNHTTLRVSSTDSLIDVMRVAAAALTCGAFLDISFDSKECQPEIVRWLKECAPERVHNEDEKQFINRVDVNKIRRIRFLQAPSPFVTDSFATLGCIPLTGPVLANGRLELLNYLREVAISIDYHRYGYLGDREGENRKGVPEEMMQGCGAQCSCI